MGRAEGAARSRSDVDPGVLLEPDDAEARFARREALLEDRPERDVTTFYLFLAIGGQAVAAGSSSGPSSSHSACLMRSRRRT